MEAANRPRNTLTFVPQLCELFGQANLVISLQERTGTKKLLRTDEDVLSAITSSAALALPNTPMVVIKLTAEPGKGGHVYRTGHVAH